MDTKLVLDMAIKFSESSATYPSNDASTDAETDEPAPPTLEEPIRPFVYRAPTGKNSGRQTNHPKRRRSDKDPRGN